MHHFPPKAAHFRLGPTSTSGHAHTPNKVYVCVRVYLLLPLIGVMVKAMGL